MEIKIRKSNLAIREMSLTFRHHLNPAAGTKASTHCMIDKTVSGASYCSIKDQFCKETGRKLALTKAIKSFPKDERRQIWDQYFKITGKKFNL